MTSGRLKCPCCGNPLGETFYQVGPVPVHSCLMLDDAEAAARLPTGDVTLSLCRSCGLTLISRSLPAFIRSFARVGYSSVATSFGLLANRIWRSERTSN